MVSKLGSSFSLFKLNSDANLPFGLIFFISAKMRGRLVVALKPSPPTGLDDVEAM